MNHSSAFSCSLDGQPDHLTPERQIHNYWNEELAGHPLFLNRSCQLTRAGELPRGLSLDPRLTEGFAPMEDMAWIRNSATRAWEPFWLEPDTQTALANMHDEQPVASLPKHYERSLAMAGVLTNQHGQTLQRRNPAAKIARCADQFQQQGYAAIAGLVHPFHISALRRYYRNLVRTGKLPFGDSQSSRRYHAHNESVARFFHVQLTGAMSKIVGETVKPSYVYFAAYQGGAFLEKHTDRIQCEFSVTLCLDYSPEPQAATPWPLQLHTSKGTTMVYQSIGDGLVYRGCEVPHSRAVLPYGHSSSSIFFHYVRENFCGTLD